MNELHLPAFAFVGTTISIVDARLLLYLFLAASVDAHIGRFLSLTASMSVGYLLNRYFTFHHLETGRALWHSLVRHYSVHAVGAGINIGVFSAVLLLGQEMGGEVAVGDAATSWSMDWRSRRDVF